MSGDPRETRAGQAPRRVAVAASASRAALFLAIPLAIVACAPQGDLGRPAPSLLTDRALPFVGRIAAELRGEPASWMILTDDERELRRRAWRFLMPAHEGQSIEAAIAELSRARVLPPLSAPVEGYHHALVASRGDSPAPLFRRIAEDAQADRALLPPFLAIATRVMEADEARLKMLLHVTTLVEGEARAAAARVAENRCLVAWVRDEAGARAGRYRYALERLAIAAPQREAIDAERSVVALEAEIGGLARLDVGTLEACAGYAARAEMAAGGLEPGRADDLGDVFPLKR